MARDGTMLGLLAILAARRLEQVGVDTCAQADLNVAEPSTRVSLETGLRLWRKLPLTAESESTGLILGRSIPITMFHLLGCAVGSAPHILGALQVFCRYFPYICDLDQLHESTSRENVIVSWEDDVDIAPAALRDFILAEICGVISGAGQSRQHPVRVTLGGDPVGNANAYEQLFGTSVKFGFDRSELEFDRSSLLVPLLSSNPAMHTTAILRLAAYDRQNEVIAGKVTGAIEQCLDSGTLNIGTVARMLTMSPRTLQKRLLHEGHNYADLVRKVRQRRAVVLLTETALPIASVAAAVGFSSVTNFSRAFRQWFCLSPGEYRRQGQVTNIW